ncbi:hypothetical protein P7C70_g4175, partial [Phenoliferia sp. Uapishka_3]
MFFVILIILFNGFSLFLAANGPFDYGTFITSYIAILVYIALYSFWKFYKKTTFVTLDAMDLTGLRRRRGASDEEVSFGMGDVKDRSLGGRVKGVVKTVWQ